LLKGLVLSPQAWLENGFQLQRDGVMRSAYNMLTHNTTTVESFLPLIPQLAKYDQRILERVTTQGRYEAVLRRQAADLKDFEDDEELLLDNGIDYGSVVGLSDEVREKLNIVRPVSIGAAKRMEGMTPTSVISLLRHARRVKRRRPVLQI